MAVPRDDDERKPHETPRRRAPCVRNAGCRFSIVAAPSWFFQWRECLFLGDDTAAFGLGARRKLQFKGCIFAERRLNPNAPTVHLDDLLGDGEPEAGAALGLGKGAVNLMELIE